MGLATFVCVYSYYCTLIFSFLKFNKLDFVVGSNLLCPVVSGSYDFLTVLVLAWLWFSQCAKIHSIVFAM